MAPRLLSVCPVGRPVLAGRESVRQEARRKRARGRGRARERGAGGVWRGSDRRVRLRDFLLSKKEKMNAICTHRGPSSLSRHTTSKNAAASVPELTRCVTLPKVLPGGGAEHTHTHTRTVEHTQHSTTHEGTWFSSFSYPPTHPGHGPSLRAVYHERNDGWTSPYSITSCTYNTYTSQIQRDQAESRAGIVHARMPRIVQSSKNFSFSQSTPL